MATTRRVLQPLQAFLATEVAGGVVLLAAAVVALGWANSPWSGGYERLWATELTLSLGALELSEDLRHWVNDLLMALFFFVVGLEVKREAVHGDLRDLRVAAVPLLCALGGMVVPALVYVAVARGEGGAGWGVPMATDIAFALGVLSLVGRRAPASLKAFLLTLAVADDIGAIVVIAVFYSDGLSAPWLLAAAAILAAVVVARRLGVRHVLLYLAAAGGLWLATFESGVHATLAGVALGLLTPARPLHEPGKVARDAAEFLDTVVEDDHIDEGDESNLRHVGGMVDEAVSPLARLEHALHPWTAFAVLPIFALANAGIDFGGRSVADVASDAISQGVAAGLVLGKPLGILAAAWLAVSVLGLALPHGVRWPQLAGVGFLAGIGFTVSIFVAGLAFDDDDPGASEAARLGVLAASVAAGAAGALVLAVGAHGRRGLPTGVAAGQEPSSP